MSTIPFLTILNGTLKNDGTLILESKPNLPPGPVRITLQPLVPSPAEKERSPSPVMEDESISPPFDLPRFGEKNKVYPRLGTERLPQPFELPEESGQ